MVGPGEPLTVQTLRTGNFMVSLSLVDSLGSHAVNVSRPVRFPALAPHDAHTRAHTYS